MVAERSWLLQAPNRFHSHCFNNLCVKGLKKTIRKGQDAKVDAAGGVKASWVKFKSYCKYSCASCIVLIFLPALLC